MENKFKIWIFLLLMGSLFGGAGGASAGTYYVNAARPDDSGDGQSWATAKKTVQAAVNVAQAGDTVIVAAGTYAESVSSYRDGTSISPITLDGQDVATIAQFTFKHDHITVKNMKFAGSTARYQGIVNFWKGSHNGILRDCVLDAGLSLDVYGVNWQGPLTEYLPFGDGSGEASMPSSNNWIYNNEIKNVKAGPFVQMYGDDNLFESNHVHDGADVDFIRIWGRKNIIRGNTFYNNYDGGFGNHPDFVQTFGDNSQGSSGIIIENNLIMKIDGQLGQLTGDGIEEITDWVFRNNVFIDITLQASIGIKASFYNNIFYKCNYVNGGHVLNFSQSSRFPNTGAHGSKVYNNAFIESGAPGSDNKGYYYFQVLDGVSVLTDVAADYNYSGKTLNGTPYSPLAEDPSHLPIGDPEKTEYLKWWEEHGINGGDPKFRAIYPDCLNNSCNFYPQPGSILIDSGADLSALWAAAMDYENVSRPQGAAWDIGAYEYHGDIIAPAAPQGLSVI